MLMLDQVVRTFAEGVIEGIRNNIKSSGMFNTGKTSDSLKYRWDGKELVIYSEFKYFTVLEDGRRPGKFAPPDVIQEWVRTKLKIVEEKENKKIAFLINRKLKEEGSLLWRQGGKSGVISEFVNAEYIQKNLTSKLSTSIIQYFTAEFGLNR